MSYTYNPRKVPQVLSVAWINRELLEIQMNHNRHFWQNFPDRCVPLFAMQCQKGHFIGTLQSDITVATGQTSSLYLPIAQKCTLIGYSATCHSSTGTPTFKLESTTTRSPLVWGALVAATPIGAGYAANTGTLNTALVPGDGVRVVLDCTTGEIARAAATLLFKATHTI